MKVVTVVNEKIARRVGCSFNQFLMQHKHVLESLPSFRWQELFTAVLWIAEEIFLLNADAMNERMQVCDFPVWWFHPHIVVESCLNGINVDLTGLEDCQSLSDALSFSPRTRHIAKLIHQSKEWIAQHGCPPPCEAFVECFAQSHYPMSPFPPHLDSICRRSPNGMEILKVAKAIARSPSLVADTCFWLRLPLNAWLNLKNKLHLRCAKKAVASALLHLPSVHSLLPLDGVVWRILYDINPAAAIVYTYSPSLYDDIFAPPFQHDGTQYARWEEAFLDDEWIYPLVTLLREVYQETQAKLRNVTPRIPVYHMLDRHRKSSLLNLALLSKEQRSSNEYVAKGRIVASDWVEKQVACFLAAIVHPLAAEGLTASIYPSP